MSELSHSKIEFYRYSMPDETFLCGGSHSETFHPNWPTKKINDFVKNIFSALKTHQISKQTLNFQIENCKKQKANHKTFSFFTKFLDVSCANSFIFKNVRLIIFTIFKIHWKIVTFHTLKLIFVCCHYLIGHPSSNQLTFIYFSHGHSLVCEI